MQVQSAGANLWAVWPRTAHHRAQTSASDSELPAHIQHGSKVAHLRGVCRRRRWRWPSTRKTAATTHALPASNFFSSFCTASSNDRARPASAASASSSSIDTLILRVASRPQTANGPFGKSSGTADPGLAGGRVRRRRSAHAWAPSTADRALWTHAQGGGLHGSMGIQVIVHNGSWRCFHLLSTAAGGHTCRRRRRRRPLPNPPRPPAAPAAAAALRRHLHHTLAPAQGSPTAAASAAAQPMGAPAAGRQGSRLANCAAVQILGLGEDLGRALPAAGHATCQFAQSAGCCRLSCSQRQVFQPHLLQLLFSHIWLCLDLLRQRPHLCFKRNHVHLLLLRGCAHGRVGARLGVGCGVHTQGSHSLRHCRVH